MAVTGQKQEENDSNQTAKQQQKKKCGNRIIVDIQIQIIHIVFAKRVTPDFGLKIRIKTNYMKF